MARELVGTRIRDLRIKKGLTQRDLASLSGISPSYLNLIEHNKRRIAGRKMLALAEALGADPRELSEGVDKNLLDRVRSAALTLPEVSVDELQDEEFVTRYPGYARLIARLFDRDRETAENLRVLSDQLNNDPYFSEAIHLLLSSITTLRSTAEILAGSDELPTVLQNRFLGNLLEESIRMTRTAEGVLDHFETDVQEESITGDQLPLDAYLERHGYFLEELEGPNAVQPDLDQFSLEDQIRAKRFFNNYMDCVKKAPLGKTLSAIAEVGANPIKLSGILHCDLPTILFRLAHLPSSEDIPDFGILECDSAGAVLYRKRIAGFSLPRYGAACPIWPIYQCLSQPLHPISAFLDLPSGTRVLSFATAASTPPTGFGQPPRMTSMMIFTADYDGIASDIAMQNTLALSVGVQCQVCARKSCASRRTDSFLG